MKPINYNILFNLTSMICSNILIVNTIIIATVEYIAISRLF